MDWLHIGPALTQEGEPTATTRDRSNVAGNATRSRTPPGVKPTTHNRGAAPESSQTRNTEAAEHEVSLAEEDGVEPPNHRRDARRGLQGGTFKKDTTQKRRYRLIRRSWVFTRSTKKQQAPPHRRLQEGDDVHGRRRRGPKGKGFPRLWHSEFQTPRQAAHRHHVDPMTMETGQHQSLWHARQPQDSPPSGAAAPETKPNTPKSRKTAGRNRREVPGGRRDDGGGPLSRSTSCGPLAARALQIWGEKQGLKDQEPLLRPETPKPSPRARPEAAKRRRGSARPAPAPSRACLHLHAPARAARRTEAPHRRRPACTWSRHTAAAQPRRHALHQRRAPIHRGRPRRHRRIEGEKGPRRRRRPRGFARRRPPAATRGGGRWGGSGGGGS